MNIFKKRKKTKLDLDDNKENNLKDNIEDDKKQLLLMEKEIDNIFINLKDYKEIKHVYDGCIKNDEFCSCSLEKQM